MITKAEKSFRALSTLPMAEARASWISRVRFEKQLSKSLVAHYESAGFERVKGDGPLTDDGREVLMVDGVALALRPEVHAERLERRMREAKEIAKASATSKKQEVRESIALTACPQMVGGKPCGGALNRKGVCPSCVTGKMGYKYRYTCESCGFDVVTKTELSE